MKYQRGLSLIELMIGVAIALFLTAVIGTVYINSKGVWRNNAALARLQEQARFALDAMSTDIRMAGYRGCGTDTTPVNTLNSTGYVYNYTKGIYGNNYVSGTTWSPALDAAISGLSPAPLAGRDVVTIWSTRDAAAQVDPPYMVNTSADLHVGANNSLSQFDIVIVQDCSASAIMQVTNSNPSTSGSVVHNTGLGTPGNSTKNLQHIFGPDATILKLSSITYYVAPSTLHSGLNALWRYAVPSLTGAPQPEELAQGVDDLQIEYGEDTDSDQVANVWRTADAVTDWTKVVAAKLNLLLVSPENNVTTRPQPYTFYGTSYTPSDRRFRSVFSTVINLRNRTP
jgi:type IV pilus assembly protein PilW